MEHLMCAQATRLSDRQLKAVKPKDKDYVLSDGDGLKLRVRVNGSTLWNFNYRQPITKNRINMGLGTYPELSLAQAGKKTVEARELLAQGIDPKEQRSELEQTKRQATEHTFENVASAWFELKKDSVTQAYAEDIWRSLTHTECLSIAGNNTYLANQCPEGHRAAAPFGNQRQPGDSEATAPTTQRDHDLRRELGNDLRQPAQWYSGRFQKAEKAEHGRPPSRRAARANGRHRQCEHKKNNTLPNRMATSHHDPSCGSRYDILG